MKRKRFLIQEASDFLTSGQVKRLLSNLLSIYEERQILPEFRIDKLDPTRCVLGPYENISPTRERMADLDARIYIQSENPDLLGASVPKWLAAAKLDIV
jgi:hypothetical protein